MSLACSFSTTIRTPLLQNEQSFQIKSVHLKWPARHVQGVAANLPINFRVVIMSKNTGLGHINYTTAFQTFACDCSGACEVAVDPPVKIQNDFDYCIFVVDEYPDSVPLYGWTVGKRFTYHSDPVKISEYLHARTISHEGTVLNIHNPKRNDCPEACASSRTYNAVYVIRSVSITD